MQTPSAPTLLRVGDAAKQASVRTDTMYRWIREGYLPKDAVVRIGTRTVRLNQEKFNAWLRNNPTGATLDNGTQQNA